MTEQPPLEAMCELYEMLQQPRRCYVLLLIGANSDPPYRVRPLAQRVTALTNSLPLAAATGEPYQNVYISLIQTHLPRLAATALIRYNDDRKLVAPGPLFPTALVVLRSAWAAYEPAHVGTWPLGGIDTTLIGD